jgi:hypothetical protein
MSAVHPHLPFNLPFHIHRNEVHKLNKEHLLNAQEKYSNLARSIIDLGPVHFGKYFVKFFQEL